VIQGLTDSIIDESASGLAQALKGSLTLSDSETLSYSLSGMTTLGVAGPAARVDGNPSWDRMIVDSDRSLVHQGS